jgi:hypothetical protein
MVDLSESSVIDVDSDMAASFSIVVAEVYDDKSGPTWSDQIMQARCRGSAAKE